MNIWGAFAVLMTLFAIGCVIGMEHLLDGGKRDMSKHFAAGSTVTACIFSIVGFNPRWVAPLVILVSVFLAIVIMTNKSDKRT